MVLPLSKIALAIQGAKAVKEMRKYVETAVQSAIGKMNLVSRAEYEEQNKQLRQLREKIETLEQSAAQTQQQTKNKT